MEIPQQILEDVFASLNVLITLNLNMLSLEVAK